MRIYRWLAPVLILLILAGMLVPVSPLYRPVPSDDPSVYLYVGQRMLEGQTPYRDAWDHKQPLAYFLFAFGQILTPHSLWGMWWIEFLLLAAAGLLALRLMLRFGPPWLAVLSVAAGLFTLAAILWGYSLEELSLALQFLILLALAWYLETTREWNRFGFALIIGLATGACFFLKQSLMGAGLTAALYLGLRMLIRREWRLWRALAGIAAGFAAVAGLVLVYLFASGAWPAYRQAAFDFNLLYANLGPLERLNAMLSALVDMASTPGLFLAFALWIFCAVVAFLQAGPLLCRWVRSRLFGPILIGGGGSLVILSLAVEIISPNPGFGLFQVLLISAGTVSIVTGLLLFPVHRRDRLGEWLSSAPLIHADSSLRVPFFNVAALYFPITLGLLALSGRNYVYYFIAMIPVLVLSFGLSAGLLHSTPQASSVSEVRRFSPVLVLLFGLGIALAYHPILLAVTGFRAPRNPPAPAVVTYIRSHTAPQDPILVWGKDTTYIYFSADRKAPSRQFYQAAISLENYNTRYGAAAELTHDLQTRPPALFIILGKPVPAGSCPLPVSDQPNTQGQVFAEICKNYSYTTQAGEFQVYRRKP